MATARTRYWPGDGAVSRKRPASSARAVRTAAPPASSSSTVARAMGSPVADRTRPRTAVAACSSWARAGAAAAGTPAASVRSARQSARQSARRCEPDRRVDMWPGPGWRRGRRGARRRSAPGERGRVASSLDDSAVTHHSAGREGAPRSAARQASRRPEARISLRARARGAAVPVAALRLLAAGRVAGEPAGVRPPPRRAGVLQRG